MNSKILTGDNKETLKTLEDCSVDAVVTDPPYGIDFLGKSWDANTGALETYQQCLRVLKPGGYMLAFSAARTYHHLAVTLEQAGFEIRDQIMWIYSSGFPKAQQIPDYPGWKTALKPAHEPICMARKPFKGSTKANMNKWGVGALNIDATRVEWSDDRGGKDFNKGYISGSNGIGGSNSVKQETAITHTWDKNGRFPSNVLGEIPDYQKFFYCPKVSRKERHTGFDLDLIDTDPGGKYDRTKQQQNANERIESKQGNNHPTVKPVALMRYLIKLVTPPGSTVLDPFCGSGSTGMAAVELGHTFIGCEMNPLYVEIAETRIGAWNTPEPTGTTFEEIFDV